MSNLQSCQRRYDAQTDERERYLYEGQRHLDEQQEPYKANLVQCWNCHETHDSDDMVDGYLFGPVCQDCDRKLIEAADTEVEGE